MRRDLLEEREAGAELGYVSEMGARNPDELTCGSLDDLRSFPLAARREAGHPSDQVQRGLDPDDWKPMPAVGPGVKRTRSNMMQAEAARQLSRRPFSRSPNQTRPMYPRGAGLQHSHSQEERYTGQLRAPGDLPDHPFAPAD